jgi:hypothetical protein
MKYFTKYLFIFLLAMFFSCKKNYNTNNDCNAKLGGTTVTKQLVFSGTAKDYCTNTPLSNVMISIFVYGKFDMFLPGFASSCSVGPDEGGREILNIRTDANGNFAVNQPFTLQNVDAIEFYQINVNAYYIYHYTNDPYIVYDNLWLSHSYFRVKNIDSLLPTSFLITSYPKVNFTGCKSLYVDSSKFNFLSLFPLRNKNLGTVYNDVMLETHDSVHWTALFGDTIKSSYGLIPNNWYGYKYWKKIGSTITEFDDSIYVDCTPVHWIAL